MLTHPHLTGRHTLTGATMAVALIALTLTATTVRSTTTTPTLQAWVLLWSATLLTLCWLAYDLADRTVAGVREEYGIAPRWARTRRPIQRLLDDLLLLPLCALALAGHLVVHGTTALVHPELAGQGWVPIVLATQVGTTIATELVLLGGLHTVMGRAPDRRRFFVAASAGLRTLIALIAVPSWPALLAVPVGVGLAVLYQRTRRLTPLILGHTIATVAITATAAWFTAHT